MLISDAVSLAQQYESPAGRPNMPPDELAEWYEEISRTLRRGGVTVPQWIDPRSSSRFVELADRPVRVAEHRKAFPFRHPVSGEYHDALREVRAVPEHDRQSPLRKGSRWILRVPGSRDDR